MGVKYEFTSLLRWAPAFAGATYFDPSVIPAQAGVHVTGLYLFAVIPAQAGIHLSAANVCGGSVNFALRC